MKTSADDTRVLRLAELGARHFEVVDAGTAYRLRVPGKLVALEVDRLAWHRGELSGELLVRCDFAGTDAIDGVLSVATFNLSSARARTERAGVLTRLSRDKEIPWGQLLEELCQRTLVAERTGDPAVPLREIERPAVNQLLNLFGFKLPLHHASMLFGDGGSAKSYLALFGGGLLAREGYRVLLADWELDGPDHRARFEALFGDDMPAGLLYLRCSRPITHEVDRLKREVRDHGIDFLIADSVGYALTDDPKDAGAALAYFRALRQIGIGSLNIAHVNRSEQGDDKPFGSAYFHNSARATWNIKPTRDAAGVLTLGVFCRKHNLGPQQAPFGIEVAFTNGRTQFRLCDIATVQEFAAQVPLTQKIQSFLRQGSKSRAEIAAEFAEDVKPETLRRTLDRELKKGRLVLRRVVGGEDEIGLAARAS